MADQLENTELQMLLNVKESGFNYQSPRHDQWNENYELYRDKVKINRLVQRQSVNLPIMKTTLRTVLKDVDDMPVIVFESLDNDKQAEVFQNEYWKVTLEDNHAELQDIVDKKQDFFFGRTFDDWQVVDGKVKFDIDDPMDIYVDRFMNPYDIDSARFLIHTHIFKPLSSLKSNPDYDRTEVEKLEEFFKTKLGIIKAQDNQNSLQKKNEKLADLGVPDVEDPVLGETYVELSYYYMFRPETKENGKTYPEQIWVYLEAEDKCILMKKCQEEIIGTTKSHYWRNHYRYNSWGDDIDKQDFWTDGIADIVRTPNKVVNAWYSQLVENRTMRNFGMTFYDSTLTADGFSPGTFDPKPFGFYPIPGKPSDVLQRVEIPDLSESLDEMEYVNQMIEKATGATSTQQGVQTATKTTLGEVQLAQGEAKARVQGMSKFYTDAWKQRATKFLMLIEAAADKIDAVKIYKKGRNTTNLYTREIGPNDWMTKSGYTVRVWNQDEKKANDQDNLTKLNVAFMNMPDNPKLKEVYQRKLLELADLTPDEITSIMEFEKQKNLQLASMGAPTGQAVPGQQMPMTRQMPGAQPMPMNPIKS